LCSLICVGFFVCFFVCFLVGFFVCLFFCFFYRFDYYLLIVFICLWEMNAALDFICHMANIYQAGKQLKARVFSAASQAFKNSSATTLENQSSERAHILAVR